MANRIIIELFQSKKGTQIHRFREKAMNGEIVHTSEGYSSRQNRKRAARERNEGKVIKWVDLTPYGLSKAKK